MSLSWAKLIIRKITGCGYPLIGLSSMKPRPFLTLLLLAATLGWLFSAAQLRAHTEQDELLPNIGVDEKLGAQLPLELTFIDQDGRAVRLKDYFTGQPVILSLNYYSCPTLCPLVFRNLSQTISSIRGLTPGKDYSIVTVSIDPEETVERARTKAQETWQMAPTVPSPAMHWPFLLGGQGNIERLAKSAGFRYARLAKGNFAHPSIFIVITPSGKVARYLYGIEIPPADLKLALMEASQGKIGGSPFLNQVLLFCYHYDPVGKRYGLAAVNIMKIAGGGILLFLGVMFLVLWRVEKHRTMGGDEGPEGRKP
jgi:protein SCO1